MKRTLLNVLTLWVSILGYAQTFTIDYITYDVTSTVPNAVMITDYDTTGGAAISIPSTVMYGGESYAVTSLGDSAFSNKLLTSVIIPNSIETIGAYAFSSNLLTNLVIPDSVTNVGEAAFEENQLTSVVLSNNMVSISDALFTENQLTNVVIPNAVLSIGGSAFSNNLIANVSMGSGVTSIGASAFSNNNISNVIIPNSVTTIEGYAFNNNQLSTIVIPENVTSIGAKAFYANSLSSVTSANTTPPIVTTGGSLDTFGGRSNIDLIIPTGTLGPYVTDAGALWTGFNTVTEDSSLGVDTLMLWKDTVRIISERDQIRIAYSERVDLNHYEVYYISGEKVILGTSNTISKSYLASGLYILQLYFDKGVVKKKFLVN
jgi:hypothetical protein